MKFYYHNFKDLRGNHIKYFANGDDFKVEEVFTTISHKNVLRGFHTSSKQEKLIKVLNGSLHLITVNEETKEKYSPFLSLNSVPAVKPPAGSRGQSSLLLICESLLKTYSNPEPAIINGEAEKLNEVFPSSDDIK